jgi:release factor glutamine methyltransferase
MGLVLHCSPGALIPRSETELLVQVALNHIQQKQATTPHLTVVDMCTGSGNIAVALGMYSANTTLLACDISAVALELARQNILQFALQERISLFCGDAFAPLHAAGYTGGADMVVCNPPYLPTAAIRKLPGEIINHEPLLALDAGAYGIDFYRRLIAGSLEVLKPGGVLLFEIGTGQEKLIGRLLERQSGYQDICYIENNKEIRVISTVKK